MGVEPLHISNLRNTGAGSPQGRAAAAWIVIVVLIGGFCMMGCGSPRPSGLLGLKWGQRASTAPESLGVQCRRWQAWPDLAPFEVCHGGPVRVYGLDAALVTFVRKGEELAGIQLVFKKCRAHEAALRKALSAELELEDEAVGYRTWRSGEVVRIEMRGDECTVTVTDSALGQAYQKHRLRRRPILGPR